MLINEPSLKIAHAILAPEARKVMAAPMAVLILGVVSQADALIELVDRVCNPVFHHSRQCAQPLLEQGE